MEKMKKRRYTGNTSGTITDREIKNKLLARKAAEEGIVLLKNEKNILPLEAGSKLVLYGAGAVKTVKGGTGSGDVNERDQVSLYEGMKKAGFQVLNEKWLEKYEKLYDKAREEWKNEILKQEEAGEEFFEAYSKKPFVHPDEPEIEKKETDTAFYVISRVAGEGADRTPEKGDYFLSDREEEALAEICSLYEKVLLVINTGGVIDLSFTEKFRNISGILQIMQPGMEGGNAFAAIVKGEVTPSGKLTDTWAKAYEDYPNANTFSHMNQDISTEKYEEGIYVGYRYFDTCNIPVRYGFGYGLSFTEFDITTKKIEVRKNKIEIQVEVKNLGTRYSGKEVVQVYVSCPYGKIEKEFRRLAAFAKTRELGPGETEELSLWIRMEDLASYDESIPGWILEAGEYGIWIGNCLQTAGIQGSILLDDTDVIAKTTKVCKVQEPLEELKQSCAEQEKRYRQWTEEILKSNKPRLKMERENLKLQAVKGQEDAEDETTNSLMEQLTQEQMIKLVMGDPGKGQGGNLGAAGISVPGSAGETNNCAEDLGLASIVLADGPAGLRLMKYYHVDQDKIVTMPFKFSVEGGFFCSDSDNLPGKRYYQYCTAIPVGTLLAQTWNQELLEEVGKMIGQEMEEFDITLWLAPGMNIHRNPLCGRNFEYYSEDPYLSGMMAAAITKGVQQIPGCGTTIKHFACNNQEDNRKGSNSVVSERTLREIYLKGFEIAIRECEPMAIMTSYNLVNGVHTANSYDLCTQVVRKEWGFRGIIMTDWSTTADDPTCTALGCIQAGNDLVMPGSKEDYESIKGGIDQGLIKEELKRSVSRLVRIILASNRYENAKPYRVSAADRRERSEWTGQR